MAAATTKKKRQKYGGRQKGTPNKSPKEIVLVCRELTPKVIARFLQILNNKSDLSAACRAGELLLKYGWGAPVQSHLLMGQMNLTGEVNHNHQHELKPLDPAFQKFTPRELTATYREALDAAPDGAGREQEGSSH